MKPLKGLEQTIGGSGIEAVAIVLDKINYPAIANVLSKFNPGVVMTGSIFPGVA
jgi:hypothetical protein